MGRPGLVTVALTGGLTIFGSDITIGEIIIKSSDINTVLIHLELVYLSFRYCC